MQVCFCVVGAVGDVVSGAERKNGRAYFRYGARIFVMALVFSLWRSYFRYGARIFVMALVFSLWRVQRG
jgi:hypothetical protein